MAELGPLGVKSTGLWVYDGLRGMRDPPMACAGLGKARGGGFDGGGSSARRRSPGRTRWAALGLGSGRKRMAGLGGLTEARNRARRPCRGGGVEGERRGRCGARGRVDAGVLWDSWLHGKLRGRAAKLVEGSGRSESRRRR